LTGTLDLSEFVNLEKLLVHDQSINELRINQCSKLEVVSIHFLRETQEIVLSSNQQLQVLEIEDCPQITEIDLTSNQQLKALKISRCDQIKKINLIRNPQIEILRLICRTAEEVKLGTKDRLKVASFACKALTDLDMTGCPNLERLNCLDTSIRTIDLSNCSKLLNLNLPRNAKGYSFLNV